MLKHRILQCIHRWPMYTSYTINTSVLPMLTVINEEFFGNVCPNTKYYNEYIGHRWMHHMRWMHRKNLVITNFFIQQIRRQKGNELKKFVSLRNKKNSLIGRGFHRVRCKKNCLWLFWTSKIVQNYCNRCDYNCTMNIYSCTCDKS